MDSSDNNQRNRSNKHDYSSVNDEVDKLLRQGNNSNRMAYLSEKYAHNPQQMAKIQNDFQEKHRKITKRAKKFATLIREKYGDSQYPFHILLEKAKLFKTKHNLTDNEFAEFQRIYEQELVGLRSPDVYPVTNNMMRVLGSFGTVSQGSLNVSEGDYKYVQEIIKLHGSSRALHSQVSLQSMQYQDCNFEAISGTYNRDLGHRPVDSVHPIVAALFIPKINVLENHFIHSSISNIIKTKYNKEPLTTRPDVTLLHALTTDPNDVVCDGKSPMIDLLVRAQLQVQLWNCILNLRNGQYYNNNFREFISSIDMCKLNKHDNPDLVYGRFDGVILKRLLSAFSFRPTRVATMPVYQVISMNPYQQNVVPVVTTVPMINFVIPPSSITNKDAVELNDALEQNQHIIEHGRIISKQTNIIWSEGVLFFYVDRRSHVLRFNDMQPFNISRLPVSISGFDRLNDTRVIFDDVLHIRDDVYNLRSVVVAEVNKVATEKNIVVGSSTIFMIHPSPENGLVVSQYFQYDPLGVNNLVSVNNKITTRTQPVNTIEYSAGGNCDPGESFQEMAQERGIIFMYELVQDRTGGTIQY